MSTAYPDIFRALAEPFPKGELKVRQGPGGRPLHYITARQAMNRLDELGPENWRDEYQWLPGHKAILCRLSIRLPNGVWLTKCDAGARSQTGDEGVDDMGAASDALKRAAVKFGVARELYGDGVAVLEAREPRSAPSGSQADPSPVASVVPEDGPTDEVLGLAEASPPPSRKLQSAGRVNSGNALYSWLMAATRIVGLDLLGLVRDWAHSVGIPTDMAGWDIGMVTAAQVFVARHLDGAGLLDISPEDRDKMGLATVEAPVPRAGPPPGPLTIHRKDPLAELKRKVIEVARPVAEAFFGQAVSEHGLRDYLVVRAREHGLEPISDLRNCSDRKAVERLLAVLYQDAADARAVGG